MENLWGDCSLMPNTAGKIARKMAKFNFGGPLLDMTLAHVGASKEVIASAHYELKTKDDAASRPKKRKAEPARCTFPKCSITKKHQHAFVHGQGWRVTR